MKILLATMQFARGYFQGTERYVRMLADGLIARGHEVLVLAGDPERRSAAQRLGERVDDALPVLHYPSRGWLSVRGIAPVRLRGLLREQRSDLVHLANPGHIGVGLLEAARQAHIPTVITVMDYWWLCPKHTLHHYQRGLCDGRVPWQECLACIAGERGGAHAGLETLPAGRQALLPVSFFGRALLRGTSPAEIGRWMHRQKYLADTLANADAVIFPSRTALELVGAHVTPARRHAIPYGLESRWFAAVPARDHTPGTRGRDELTVGYAGALAPHKGVHILIDALQRLGPKTVRLEVAGAGAADHEQRLRAAAAGLNVTFHGRISSERMPAFLDGLDVLVIPSLWPENLPIAALEAYARRLPVIASGVGGLAEVVPADALFELGSAAELAKRLAAFRNRAIGNALPNVLVAGEMVARTTAVYESVCAARPADWRAT